MTGSAPNAEPPRSHERPGGVANLKAQADVDNPTGPTASQTATVGMSTPDAFALLPLPEHLSDAQRDGHVCVYDGDALTAQTAVDLGARTLDGRTAFPRACHTAVNRAALGVLFDHCSGTEEREACQECKEREPDMCEIARALNRLIRMRQR